MDKPACPYAVKKGGYSAEADEYFSTVMCDLVEKYCLIEYGDTCETYDEFLKEEDDTKQ